eukprot:5864242-Pyramimonas_sp.AAC.1
MTERQGERRRTVNLRQPGNSARPAARAALARPESAGPTSSSSFRRQWSLARRLLDDAAKL